MLTVLTTQTFNILNLNYSYVGAFLIDQKVLDHFDTVTLTCRPFY